LFGIDPVALNDVGAAGVPADALAVAGGRGMAVGAMGHGADHQAGLLIIGLVNVSEVSLLLIDECDNAYLRKI
jgi:hypothetical protein